MFKSLAKKLLPDHAIWAIRYFLHPKKFDVVGGPLTYKKDGLATAHNSSTLHESDFQRAYEAAKATGSFSGSWGLVDPQYRTYIYCWSAYHCQHLAGDWVECGVNKGGMARAAIEYTNFSVSDSRKYYLLDTFSGTPEHFLQESVTKKNRYEECFEQAQQNFRDFSNVILIRGEVPGTLSQVPSQTISFLSLDMNCVEPEIAALDFFWDKLVPGGIVILDDYNNIGHEDQKQAHDKFASQKNLKVMSLPTGQGLIFKV